jgi:peptide-methionine (R)-S-oxide reductase
MLNWNDVLNLATKGNHVPERRVEKTDDEWKQQLTAEQFYVTRQHGTERSFSHELCRSYAPGLYSCVCCDTLLFDSTVKFDSGTGWPSFTQPIKENAVKYIKDRSFGMTRIEAQCNVCDAHLGHVFPDGPAPSGLRYCMNGESLVKEVKEVEG